MNKFNKFESILFVLDRNIWNHTYVQKPIKNQIHIKCKYKCTMNAIP